MHTGTAYLGELAGIFWFDGRPIDAVNTKKAVSNLKNYQTKQRPGLFMAWETTCSVCKTPDLLCSLDGRTHHEQTGAGAGIALQFYRQSGVDGLSQLVGDWSLELWDEGARTLILASDYAGARPLYYFRSADCLAWSSSLEHLANWMDCHGLDHEYVAAFLRTGLPQELTPYRGIYPVPAGSAVTASADGVAIQSIWSPPTANAIRYRDEAQYEEHFRTLFRQAVAVRLDGGSPVAAELSGGLDSSSIVSMADSLISTGAVTLPGLTTFSYLLPGSPDQEYIGIAERSCRSITPVHLDGTRYPMLTPSTPGGALPIWAETRLGEIRRRMDDLGLRALVTGQLGDLVTANVCDDSEQAADCFSRGQFAAGAKEALEWSRHLRTPVYGILWRAICSSWVFRRSEKRAGACPSQSRRLRALSELRAARFFQCPEPLTGLLYSHPFTHRPLVEFLLSVPPNILCRPGEPRRLMRHALKGIVPEAILRRRSKGNYEGLFLESLRPCATDLLRSSDDLWLARMGCVDRRSAASLLGRVSQGVPFGDRIPRVIRLEHWLRRSVERGAIALADGGLPEMGIV